MEFEIFVAYNLVLESQISWFSNCYCWIASKYFQSWLQLWKEHSHYNTWRNLLAKSNVQSWLRFQKQLSIERHWLIIAFSNEKIREDEEASSSKSDFNALTNKSKVFSLSCTIKYKLWTMHRKKTHLDLTDDVYYKELVQCRTDKLAIFKLQSQYILNDVPKTYLENV